jgi:hypothetical protein
MFSSNFHSLTHLRGYNAPMTMPKATCFAGICRTDWNEYANTGRKQVSFSTISDKNIDSPKHPQLDNC